MTKHKDGIIPAGDIERESQEEQKKFQQEQESAFYKDPLIPWWVKTAYQVCSIPSHKSTRVPRWCKLCGQKHSRREGCENLRLVEDLTAPPTKTDNDGHLIHNRKIGFYTTRPKEVA